MNHLDDLALARALDQHDVHLDGCASCRLRFDHLARVRDGLAALPAPAPSNMAADVVRRITTPRDGGNRRMALGALIGAAGAVVAMLVTSSSSTFTARGGSDAAPVEVAAFIDGGAGRVPLTRDTIAAPGFTLSFRALRRVSTDRAPRHLMIFGCDAAGDLHWAVPAWDDASADPTGPLVDAPLVEIPTALQPEAPPGPFTLVTLTTTAPVGVKRVEALVANCRTNALATLPGVTLSETPFNIR